ncbi:MAG: tRNA adenosine(34) deaminase TadA [Gemmatimonadetes bacterium]|nr:tRNA adenosine(34) deaminase TadA [Gemmatimonadota bacterium]
MPQPLRPREQRLIDYLVAFVRENGFQPSIREMGEALGLRSTRSVYAVLATLEKKGWIERDRARSRAVRLLADAEPRGSTGVDGLPGPVFDPPDAGDASWMARALELAGAAIAAEEVPVGAVLVDANRLVAESHNRMRTNADPTAHAELVTIRAAVARLGQSRLEGATLYVTLEPCAMCAGAIVLARVQRLVYAATDPKSGMCGSLACIVQDRRLNHRVRLTRGVLAEPAGTLLRGFFRDRRPAQQAAPQAAMAGAHARA